MVDAPASYLAALDRTASASAIAARPLAFAAKSIDVAAYVAACNNAVFAPAQSPAWIAAWLRNMRPDAHLAAVLDEGRPVLAIALQVDTTGPFKVARLVGGGHANGNFPPLARHLSAQERQHAVAALVDSIAKVRTDIDLLALERLVPAWQGLDNPFQSLPWTTSPNVALAIDLTGGFDALLSRAHGARKRKKHRYQTRRLQAGGDIRRLTAKSAAQARLMLDAFFDMKSGRLKKLGVPNVFGGADIQNFFNDLFAEAAESADPAFRLEALEVGGKLRAITGSSLSRDRLICDFAAIADDELMTASPGDYLFFENIAAACGEGLTVYDFGVGDEPYKRSWCDIETEHFDVWMPMSTRGKLLAVALSAKARLKAHVKRQPLAWKLWKALRSRANRG